MGDTADEIDHLAAAYIKRQQCRQVAAKNNPQRSRRRNGKRQCHARCCDLAQQQKTEAGGHQRHQGEYRRRRDRIGRLQTFKHQHEIDGEQSTKHKKPPGCREMRKANAALQEGHHPHHDCGKGKPRCRDCLRVNIIGNKRTKAE